jgi:methionine synthase I (cobalamin-dependent)
LAKEVISEARGDGDTEMWVFASLGPAGVFLEPLGNVSRRELLEAIEAQVRAFKDAGTDGVCVETLSDIIEAELAIQAVKEEGLECIALMCFEPSPRGFHTMMGVNVPRAVDALIKAGADAIGAGCGVGSTEMVEIAKEMRSITGHPLVTHPNAGRPEYRGGRAIYPETPGMMAEKAVELAAIGVNVIGGCCGSTPEHIVAIVDALRREFPSKIH